METNHLPQARVPRIKRSPQFKADVVSRALQPGASHSAVAVGAGVNPNLLRKWIRQSMPKQLPTPAFAKVVVHDDRVGPSQACAEALIPIRIARADLQMTLDIPLSAAGAFAKAVLL
jgi:transposase-like protein